MNIRLFKPSLGDRELANIGDSFQTAWLGLGPKVGEFEKRWSRFVGVKESVAVNSCTAALHLAVSAFKFKPGKKVLVPALTFSATAMAPLYNGLIPVFVDVDPATGGISLEDLERKIDKDCVAVIPVHYNGHPVPMDRLNELAHTHGLKVVEDCAHTAGGEYKGRKLGTWGEIGCYSFEEKKCMTTGDGGMISSNDTALLKPLRAARWVGIDKDTWTRLAENADGDEENAHWYYEIHDLGYKYNMNDLSASIGLAQLEKIEAMNAKRADVIRRYMEGIRSFKRIRPGLPYALENASYQMFMVRVSDRTSFIRHMKKNGVATGVHYMPLPMHPFFSQFQGNTPVADQLWREIVTLPLHVDLTSEEVDYVIRQMSAYENGGLS